MNREQRQRLKEHVAAKKAPVKRDDRPKPPPQPAKPTPRKREGFLGRYPEGTGFEAAWSGELWAATITVPVGVGKDFKAFAGFHQSIHRLLRMLAAEYVAWLKETGSPEAEKWRAAE